jgi:transposase InsO family protein
MPNEIGPRLEQRIVAFSLAHPGFGARRISAELAREKWGGIRISEHGVWRVLCRVGLNTRAKRLALIARHRDPYERAPSLSARERHIDASQRGEIVQMDCFFIGRLSGSNGSVWQYTTIDVASGFTRAEPHSSRRNLRSRHCQALLHRLARELALAGWKLRTVTTDNHSEFASSEFGKVLAAAGARQRRIKAGRPTANGCLERVQLTILEECWPPSFARSLVPKLTALTRDLDEFLHYYNTDRAYTGRHTKAANRPTSSTVPARCEQRDDLSRPPRASAA